MLLFCWVCVMALLCAGADDLSEPTRWVDPNQKAPKTSVISVPTEVKIDVRGGQPFALESNIALPD